MTSSSSTARAPGLRVRLQVTGRPYPKPALIDPTPLGYVYLAAAVQPGATPLVMPSVRRSRLVNELEILAPRLRRADGVVNATVFRAIVIPPAAGLGAHVAARAASVHRANFDVVVLVQTTSLATARTVEESRPFALMVEAIRRHADALTILTAGNVRRIADVDTTRPGLFLFDHLVADDVDVVLELWECLAGWYAAETGLRNSVALRPLAGRRTDYAIVNWARWEVGPLRHFWHQLSKPSFWNYVVANLDANHAASMPIYYRLAAPTGHASSIMRVGSSSSCFTRTRNLTACSPSTSR